MTKLELNEKWQDFLKEVFQREPDEKIRKQTPELAAEQDLVLGILFDTVFVTFFSRYDIYQLIDRKLLSRKELTNLLVKYFGVHFYCDVPNNMEVDFYKLLVMAKAAKIK